MALAVCVVLNLRDGMGLANVEGHVQTGVIGALLIVSVLAQNLIDRLPTSPASGFSTQPTVQGSTSRKSSRGARGIELARRRVGDRVDLSRCGRWGPCIVSGPPRGR